MKRLTHILKTEISLGPSPALARRSLALAGRRLSRSWRSMRRGAQGLIVCCSALLLLNVGILVTGPLELHLKSRFIGITLWAPFQDVGMVSSFIYSTPAPVTFDYSDGACRVRRWTRVACFYWGYTIPGPGCDVA